MPTYFDWYVFKHIFVKRVVSELDDNIGHQQMWKTYNLFYNFFILIAVKADNKPLCRVSEVVPVAYASIFLFHYR